jgi:hypothetical protein
MLLYYNGFFCEIDLIAFAIMAVVFIKLMWK